MHYHGYTLKSSLQYRDEGRWVFTDRAGVCLHRTRGAVKCLASRVKGQLYPTKDRLLGGLWHIVRKFFIVQHDSFEATLVPPL